MVQPSNIHIEQCKSNEYNNSCKKHKKKKKNGTITLTGLMTKIPDSNIGHYIPVGTLQMAAPSQKELFIYFIINFPDRVDINKYYTSLAPGISYMDLGLSSHM